jgi:hypothetical protein
VATCAARHEPFYYKTNIRGLHRPRGHGVCLTDSDRGVQRGPWAVGLVIRERGRDPGRDWRASLVQSVKEPATAPTAVGFFSFSPLLFSASPYTKKKNFKPLLSTPHSHLDTQYKINSTAAMHMHLITMSKQLIITWAGDRERSAVDD